MPVRIDNQGQNHVALKLHPASFVGIFGVRIVNGVWRSDAIARAVNGATVASACAGVNARAMANADAGSAVVANTAAGAGPVRRHYHVGRH